MRHRPQRQAPAEPRGPSPFGSLRVFIPHADKKLLVAASVRLGLPQSRLMQIALDNELDQPHPFHYPTTLPTTDYIEGAYTDEASKIFRFLDNFKHGVGRDMLMLCRREMGIIDRDTMMFAFRELLEQEMIVEVDPPKSDRLNYLPGYKLTMLKNEDLKRLALVKEKRARAEQLMKEAKDLERGE